MIFSLRYPGIFTSLDLRTRGAKACIGRPLFAFPIAPWPPARHHCEDVLGMVGQSRTTVVAVLGPGKAGQICVIPSGRRSSRSEAACEIPRGQVCG